MKKYSSNKLSKNYKQTARSERMRILGEMINGIAHNFKNTLTSICGYSELLLSVPENLKDQEKTARYIKTIHEASQMAIKTVKRLNDFSSLGKERNFVSIASLITNTIELTRPKWENQAQVKGVTIDISCQLNVVPNVFINEGAFCEVLGNLIFNAADAMPDGGNIVFYLFLEKNCVVLKIEDNGLGMDEHQKQHCFEPYFSTKGIDGSGLGLCTSKDIIENHDGTIHMESEVNKGTIFTICLPFDCKEKEKKNPTNYFRILIVDDRLHNRELLNDILLDKKYTVEMASNGQDAWDMFKQQPFDVVITDLSMPNMNGYQLACKIKDREPSTFVALATGFDKDQSIPKDANQIDFFLSKPLQITEIQKKIAYLYQQKESRKK